LKGRFLVETQQLSGNANGANKKRLIKAAPIRRLKVVGRGAVFNHHWGGGEKNQRRASEGHRQSTQNFHLRRTCRGKHNVSSEDRFGRGSPETGVSETSKASLKKGRINQATRFENQIVHLKGQPAREKGGDLDPRKQAHHPFVKSGGKGEEEEDCSP